MQNKNLIYEIKNNGIGYITLNRPEKNNAFNAEFIAEFLELLEKINADDNIRVVLLKAQGKNFCAGADVEWMQSMKNFSYQENLQDAAQLAKLFQILNNLNKPTIALVQGNVSGGGNGLIACCDIVVASDAANFCFSEVKLGIIPASISPYVIAAIGQRAARRYFLTAEKFSAEEALRIGLIHQVISADQLEETGLKFIQQILKNGPQSLAICKRWIQRCAAINSDLIKDSVELIADVRLSLEAQEGLQAFLEKRNPIWDVNK